MKLNSLDSIFKDIFKPFEESNRIIKESLSFAPNMVYKTLSNVGLVNINSSSENKLTTFNHQEMSRYLGTNKQKLSEFCIGDHPDFSYLLGESNSLNHYSVSCFIDIAGSTKMNEDLSLLQIRFIKDTILTLCIYFANFFGGHVHRLQGDGIFIQFVRKEGNHLDSIINSLNATSFILRTVNDIINPLLKSRNLLDVKLRAGIDYGSEDLVLWSNFGIPNCSELTTTSFHTDSAAKLQSLASPGEIVIGNNIKNELDLPDYLTAKKGEKIMDYKCYTFKHLDYLDSYSFFEYQNATKNSLTFINTEYTLKCNIQEYNNSRYYENSYSIPKDYNIEFTLLYNNQIADASNFEYINWRARNSGKQARLKNDIEHNFGYEFDGKAVCKAHTKYLGHHKAICEFKAKDNHRKEVIEFPIFVQ